MKVVCTIRTEHMTNYTLNKTYEVINLSHIDNKVKVLEAHRSYYIKDDDNNFRIWNYYEINRYFKSLREFNLIDIT